MQFKGVRVTVRINAMHDGVRGSLGTNDSPVVGVDVKAGCSSLTRNADPALDHYCAICQSFTSFWG